MKRLALMVGALALGLAGSVAAQSLEETYANLCSDETSKQNEACVALRNAMLEKLSAESGQQPRVAPMPHSENQISQNASRTDPSAAVLPSESVMAALSSDTTSRDPRWGVLSRLVDTQWAGEDVGDKTNPELPRVYRHFVSFSLLDDGEALEIQEGVELTRAEPARVFVLRPTARAGVYKGEIRQPRLGEVWQTTFRTDETGAVVSDWYKVINAGHGLRELHARVGYRLMPDGTLAHVGARGWERDRPALSDPSDPQQVQHRLRPYTQSDFRLLVSEQIASWPDLLEQQRQTAEMQRQNEVRRAQMQRERAARRASSGGIFGALVGAAVGAYAGSAAGMDVSQTADLMMRGAAAASGNSGVTQGFARGIAEETAKNDAMAQSMRNAANEGLATGAAEYARSQPMTSSANSTSTVRVVEDRPATDRQAAAGTLKPAQNASAGSSNAVALLMKGFRGPITPGATSNEMCFALVNLGPITDDPSQRNTAAREAVASREAEFLRRCAALGALSNGTSLDDLSFDERAQAGLARARANRWMHEVAF